MSAVDPLERDARRASVVLAARPELGLAPYNRAGVLEPVDVHVAELLVELAGLARDDPAAPALALATALAVRAPRLGNVCVDLASVADTLAIDGSGDGLAGLSWPDPGSWCETVAAAATLVSVEGGGDADADGATRRPLRLLGSRLFLERYWRQEQGVAETLRRLDGRAVEPVDLSVAAELLERHFPDRVDHAQRAGAATMALRGLTVLAGGPGTGKTTTVARGVAVIVELARRERRSPPLIALSAPTGKATARLAEAIREQVGALDVPPGVREHIMGLGAGTIHRLLGARGEGRFTHHARNPLPHDLVIVDETSMVSLSLMSHLLAAVRRDARVVLVGDPDQLSAIEAGAVLRDIVGPVGERSTVGPAMRALLRQVTGEGPGDGAPAPDPADAGSAEHLSGRRFGDGVVLLRRSHRFGSEIAELADAVRRGDTTAALERLGGATGAEPTAAVRWISADPDAPDPASLGALRTLVGDAFAPLLAAARAGDGAEALDRLGHLRLLCAHRRGPWGISTWTATVEAWLADRLGVGLDGDYPGRPLLLTENDQELRLFNGDTGVVIATPDGVSAVFAHDPDPVQVPPARLGAVETAYATTIHKSQGSQFGTAVVIVPGADSRLLSRELLYTAITRARHRLVIVGSPAAVEAAIARPVQRATGLGERLWSGSGS